MRLRLERQAVHPVASPELEVVRTLQRLRLALDHVAVRRPLLEPGLRGVEKNEVIAFAAEKAGHFQTGV